MTFKDWGPPMDRTGRLQSIGAGSVFSYFDLAKGFLGIPIPEQDKHILAFISMRGFMFSSASRLGLSIAGSTLMLRWT